MSRKYIVKVDKICLSCILISFVLLISAYGFFIEHNGFNEQVAEKMAAGLAMLNPSDHTGPSFEGHSQLYLNESRSIILIYVVSIILAIISFIRAVSLKIRKAPIHNVGILIAASIGLVISNINLIFTSGVWGGV